MDKLNIKIIFLTVLVGFALTLSFAYIMADQFAAAMLPTIALLSAFIVTGFVVGFFSKGVTFIEPGIGSIVVAALLFFTIPALNLKGFQGMWTSGWLIIYMNAILLTFAGAWLGEKFEDAELSSDQLIHEHFDWSWMIAGTMMGLTVSMIIVNLLDLILGHNPDSFIVPYFASLLITGLVVGWKSPGYTVLEAGLAGYLTVTIIFNIARMTIITESEIGVWYIIIGTVLGFVVSIIGGFIGEKIQTAREKKA